VIIEGFFWFWSGGFFPIFHANVGKSPETKLLRMHHAFRRPPPLLQVIKQKNHQVFLKVVLLSKCLDLESELAKYELRFLYLDITR